MAHKLALPSNVKLAEPKVEGKRSLPRYNILAYTGKQIDLTDYGIEHPVVYVINGIQLKNKVPYLLNHWQPIGHMENIKKTANQITGDAIHSYPSEASSTVAEAIDNEFPFQSSMGLEIEEKDVTFVAEGVVEVNNQTFNAPIYVVNKSVLVEQTATMFGRDDETTITKLSKETLMRIKNASGSGPNPTPPTAPAPAPAPAPTYNPFEIIKLSKLVGDNEDLETIVKNGMNKGDSIETISNAVKLHTLEHNYPKPPSPEKGDSNKQENHFLARLGISLGVEPEFLETKLDKETVGRAFDEGQMGLREMVTLVANSNGGNFTGHSDIEAASKYVKRINNNQQYSTIVFPNLLEKVTQFAMEEHWGIGKPWAIDNLLHQSQSNFNPTGRIRPSGGQIWNKLDGDGRIQHGTFGEEKTYLTALETIAQILIFKRRDIINDDMGIIEEMLSMMVEGATMAPDLMFVKRLYDGITSGFLKGGVNAAFGTTATFGRDSLKSAYDTVRKHTIIKGDKEVKTNFNTKWKLVIPQALEMEAFEILQQSRIVAGTDAVVGSQNYWYNRLTISVFDNLDNDTYHPKAASDVWGIIPERKNLAPYSITFLNGQKRPTTESVDIDADMLGSAIRGYWDLEVNEREEEATFWNFPSETAPAGMLQKIVTPTPSTRPTPNTGTSQVKQHQVGMLQKIVTPTPSIRPTPNKENK